MKVVGDIVNHEDVMLNATYGVVDSAILIATLVRSGSLYAGMGILNIEFMGTLTSAKVIVPSVKIGGLFGTLTVMA